MLDLASDAARLTAALVDVESVSGDEARLADLVEAALRRYPQLAVERDGDAVLARTALARDRRVVLAGHLDTVPVAGNLPSRRDGDTLWGCGTSDMKSGVAVMLRVAHLVGSGALDPGVDLTWVCYECEEIEAARNGLGRLARTRPAELAGDLAILLEPTGAVVEGGCQGTLRVVVRLAGIRAHSARSWLGQNAIHAAAPVLARLASYDARTVDVDGLTYREGLNAVGISGGVAGNVVPDECAVTVNYRFAPDRSEADALAHVRDVFAGFDVELTDSAPAARPGLDTPIAGEFVAAVGGAPRAKLGWTDVARFGGLGVPALNFGPGDPNLAHKADEHVSVDAVLAAEESLVRFLSA
ncbi:succinyldiaminopimelate desuccinylase [Jatrophihabitans endophyticus]|uniref:Succinyl-diaminopimelate desuccinylase n=1 Tax=Jatrophihabitans endophyticus TaxID=1206085 RepID=A0A1M5T9Y9_9ACTN|nr:succinyl-diaminopimelate desuccinylase [Jatrophihabitans endophyticus]SHH47595.1 succinyldiaminopimelate desuccinylase [Jatrophihabitans endophyticus]